MLGAFFISGSNHNDTRSDAMGRIQAGQPVRPGGEILHRPEDVDLLPADIQLWKIIPRLQIDGIMLTMVDNRTNFAKVICFPPRTTAPMRGGKRR